MHKSTAFNPTRALSNALDLLMKAPLPLWVGGLVLIFVEGLAQGGAQFRIDLDGRPEDALRVALPFVAFGLCFGLVVALVTAWLRIGYYQAVRTVMRDGDAEFGELYRASNRWLAVFLAGLVQGLANLVAALPLALFGGAAALAGQALGIEDGLLALLILFSAALYLPVLVYVSLGLSLTVHAAVLEERGPVEAALRSWELASGVRVQLLLMSLLSLVLVIAGLLMCCVGVIPAAIVIEVLWCEAYVQATRDGEGWWIDHRGSGGGPPDGGVRGGGEWDPVEGAPTSGAATPGLAGGADPGRGGAAPEDGEPGGFDPSAWRRDP